MNRDNPLNLLILGFWTGPYLLAWTWAAWLNEVNACLEELTLTCTPETNLTTRKGHDGR